MNVKGITRDQIRTYLDEVGTSTRVDSDGDLFTVFPADEEFNHNVVIFFYVKDNSLGVYAFATEFQVPEEKTLDALIAINQWNAERKFPKVYLKDQIVQAEQWFALDEEVSVEYIKENCIRMMIALIWRFFVEFKY